MSLHTRTNGSNTFSVTLAHHNGTHKDLNGADVLEGNLAFAGCLVEAKGGAKLLFRHGARGIDLVAKNQEGRR